MKKLFEIKLQLLGSAEKWESHYAMVAGMTADIAEGIARKIGGYYPGLCETRFKEMLEKIDLEFIPPSYPLVLADPKWGDNFLEITSYDADDGNKLPSWWTKAGKPLASRFGDFFFKGK